MVALLRLMALLRPVGQKANEVKFFYLIYIIANKNNPKTEVSNNLSGVKKQTNTKQQTDSY